MNSVAKRHMRNITLKSLKRATSTIIDCILLVLIAMKSSTLFVKTKIDVAISTKISVHKRTT